MIIEALLAIGADVNEADSDGQTPLHWLASWGHASSCRLLVKKEKQTLRLRMMAVTLHCMKLPVRMKSTFY